MQAKIYNQEGKETGKVTLPDEVFAMPWNDDLVHQVVSAMQSNARTPVAHAKDRSEVRGGGKKPWKQKGTGRARHGSIRSPIWTGGGVTHGPSKERNYKRNTTKKMRTKALYATLSAKLRDNEIIFVDSFSFGEIKSANARNVLTSLSGVKNFEDILSKKKNSALVLTFAPEEKTYKSFSNFGNIAVGEVRNLNPVDALTYKYLIISNPKESIDILLKKSTSEPQRLKLKKQESKV